MNSESVVWEDYASHEGYGGIDTHYIFKTIVHIESQYVGKPLTAHISTGATDIWNNNNPQFIAYVNGDIIRGLDINHTEFELTENAKLNEEYEITLYSYCSTEKNDIFLNAYLGVKNKEVEAYYYDIKTIFDVISLLDYNDVNYFKMLEIMNEAVSKLDLRQVGSTAFFESINESKSYLKQAFYQDYCKKSDIIEHCIGHTHIDVAWLWTLDQTREKVIRSFASVVYLMNHYPEYKFMSSQPQLYEYIKQNSPKLYKKIKELVKQGRWEVEGSMWVEADCNLASGESLVRQIIHGKRFFKEEFNKDNEVLWLPDVFGYSAALPQIMKKSEINYFMTTKINWNDTNKMPNDTFMWKGIDGSVVLTHFITTSDYTKEDVINTTYNGLLNASQVKGTWQRYQNKDISKQTLQCYGYGDGGGGPTAEMLEYQRRFEKGIPTMPTTKQSFVKEFFKELESEVQSKDVPEWWGELYLEYHRGTYTTMAQNKKWNRQSENSNLVVEFLSSLANLLGVTNYYPVTELEENWKLTLLNQFHDIIPGTAIEEVYTVSKQQYHKLLDSNQTLIQKSLEEITKNIAVEKDGVIVFNSLSFQLSSLVEVEVPSHIHGIEVQGKWLKSFKKDNKLTFLAEDIPPKGYQYYAFRTSKDEYICHEFTWNEIEKTLATPYYRVAFNENGELTSLYDYENLREILKERKRGNVFKIFEDRPWEFDAWNIEKNYTEKVWEIDSIEEFQLLECTNIKTQIYISRNFLNSKINQVITFYSHTRRIDFNTTVDWQEKNLLLKVEFPIDVFSNKGVFDIQFGNVERPLHQNTSWDQARFEVCAHKWADISEADYGVSLLNDCKYGYDVIDGNLRLSLLRGTVYPHKNADKGRQSFTYALLPHKGDFRTGDVIEEAYSLNTPVYSQKVSKQSGSLSATFSLMNIEAKNVVCEVIKLSENKKGYIIRMYESWGKRTATKLNLEFPIKELWECNLLEKPINFVNGEKNTFDIVLKPYEIKTYLAICKCNYTL